MFRKSTSRSESSSSWNGFVDQFPKLDHSLINPSVAFRNTLGVVLPLIAAAVTGNLQAGMIMGFGALVICFSDGPDSYRSRGTRMFIASILCAIATFVGGVASSHFALATLSTLLWGFAAGMLVVVDTVLADIGVVSLTVLLMFAASPVSSKQAIIFAGLCLIGALFQTSLALVLWPIRRYKPERRELASLYFSLSQLATQSVSSKISPAGDAQSTHAQKFLEGLSRDRTLEADRYRLLMVQAERIRLRILLLSRLRRRLSRDGAEQNFNDVIGRFINACGSALSAIAKIILSRRNRQHSDGAFVVFDGLVAAVRAESERNLPPFTKALLRDTVVQLEALEGQVRNAKKLAENSTPSGAQASLHREAQRPVKNRYSSALAVIRANLTFKSAAFRHSLRLAIAMAVGILVGHAFGLYRPYWIPMTIAICLKPEFGNTFAKTLFRVLGTYGGLFLATGLLHFLPGGIYLKISLVAVFTFGLRWLGAANYGIFAACVSALVVFLLSFAGVSSHEVIMARGLNTFMGGALAVIASLFWPTYEKNRVPEVFAQLLDSYRAYFVLIADLSFSRIDEYTLDRARIAARVARSNFQGIVLRLETEPGTSRFEITQFEAMQASTNRFAHSMMALEAAPSAEPRSLPAENAYRIYVENVQKNLSLLAETVRGRDIDRGNYANIRGDYEKFVEIMNQNLAEPQMIRKVELDKMTDSLNSLREQIWIWKSSNLPV